MKLFPVYSIKYAPIKKIIARYGNSNNNPYMARTLRKAIVLRLKLKYKYNKSRSTGNWNN